MRLIVATVALSLTLTLGPPVLAQQATIRADGSRVSGRTPSPTIDWRWTHDKWDADERPFRVIRTAVDSFYEAQNKDKLVAVSKKYRDRWIDERLHKRINPVTVFGLAYSAWKAAKLQASTGSLGVDAQNALRSLTSVHSYELARIWFLFIESLATPEYFSLGERLLQHDNQDQLVEYYLLERYPKRTVDQVRRASQLAEDLIKRHPDWPAGYAVYGGTFLIGSKITRDWADVERAKKGYTKYLVLAKASDSFRPQAERLLQRIQKKLDTHNLDT